MHPDSPEPRPDGEPVDWAYETPAAPYRRDETRTPMPTTISPTMLPQREYELDESDAWEDLGKGVMLLGFSALGLAGGLAFLAAIAALVL